MSSAYQIPFDPKAQSFTINLGGISYQLKTTWNGTASCWILDIASADGTPLASGLPLVPGVDILSQVPNIGIAGKIFVQGSPKSVTPGYADLGTTGLVFFVVP